MSIKYGKKILFLTLICSFAFLNAAHFAEARLQNYSCSGPGTSYESVTKADPTYYDPPPAPKINQFFCSTVGDTYFGKPGVDYLCTEGGDQTAPGNLRCTRCTSWDSSYNCTSYNLADYYTCTYLGRDPYLTDGYLWTQYYPGYVYDNCTPSIISPTVSISASPLSIVTSQSSTLTWSSTGNAASCAASGGWSGAQATSGSQSVSPLSTTTYTITCSNSAGSSPPRSVTVTILDSTPPSVPAGLAAAAVSSSQINLSWGGSTDTGGSGLAGYRVYRCQGAGCTDFTQIAAVGPILASYSNTGLTPSTSYSYYVTAYDDAGNESPASNTATDITQLPPDTTPPSAVSNLAASSPTFNSIALSWTAPGDDSNTGTASVYDLRYSTAVITGANWSAATPAIGEPAPLAAGNSQNMVVSGLNPLTTYYFTIRTRDEVGNESPLSNIASLATTNIPDTTPPVFAFTSPASGLLPIGTTATILSGTTNEPATCRYAVSAGQNFDTGMTAFPTTGETNHSQTISGLSNGGLYAYYVKCRDAAVTPNTSGDFAISFAVDSPLPDTTPPAISNGAPVGTLAANTSSVTMSVRTNEPAYCAYSLTDMSYGAMVTAGNTMTPDIALTYHSVFLSGLANGASYLYYIRCQDTPGGNENATSYPISFSVANPPNVLPVANMTVGPLSGLSPLVVTADGAASYDTDGTIAYYTWQWGDGTSDTAGAAAFTASHTYTAVGTYTLTLTVRDNQGGIGTAQQTITVNTASSPPPISTTGICAPMCTQNSDCLNPGYICGPNGICVANGSGVGPARSNGAFSLDGSAWQAADVTPPNFPANTASVVMRVQTDANAECQYSETPDAAYGNTAFMKQFDYTGSATSTATLAIPKMSVVSATTTAYNYYVRCKDSQTGVVNNIDYYLSFTVGGPTLISGPSSYVCWINQNFIKSGIPYLFDICRPQCSVNADCPAPTPTCDLVKKVCIP